MRTVPGSRAAVRERLLVDAADPSRVYRQCGTRLAEFLRGTGDATQTPK